MNELQVFNYGETPVRTVMQSGEPWWVLSDVCRVLELGTPAKVAQRLDEDEKGMNQIHTLGGSQQMTIINESGLYKVILRSDKPEAKKFTRWVTHEVLPAIRKTGSYSVSPYKPKASSVGEVIKLVEVTRSMMEEQGCERMFTGSTRNIALQTTSKRFPISNFPDRSPSVVGSRLLISGSAALGNVGCL